MNEVFRLFGTLGLRGVDEAERDLQNVTSQAEQSSNKMGAAFKKIGAAVAAAFTIDKIKDFGVAIVHASAEVEAEEAAFTQIMGAYTDKAAAKVAKIAEATGMVNSRLTPYMTSMTAKFKGLGYGIDEATDFATRGLNLAADASAFWDKSLDDSMGHLNSFINGSYEGGEAIGLFANDTQMAAYAVKTGVVSATKEWANLDEATKQATRLEYAENMFKQSGAVGQAAKESDQYANVQANLNEKWRQFKAQVGEPVLQNIVIPAMKRLGDFITDNLVPGFENLKTKIQELNNWYKEHKALIDIIVDALIVLAAAFVGLKAGLIIQKIVQGFQAAQVAIALFTAQNGAAALSQAALNGTLTIGETIVALLTGKMTLAQLATGLWTKAQAALNAVMAANPIALVIVAIAALIAIIVLCVKHWEKIKEAGTKAWEGIKNAWSSVSTWFKEKVIDPVVNFFKNNWQTILLFMVNPIAGAFKLIYEKCEGFRNFINGIVTSVGNFFKNLWNGIKSGAQSVWNAITNTFNKVKNAMLAPVEKARDAIKNVIEKIKSLFSFKWSLPKLKVPKFSINPSGWKVGDLLKGKIPKLGVTWNAEGAIFNRPAIFDTAYGLQGVGEAGAEAVAPIDKLQDYVRNAVREENSGLESQISRLYAMLANYFPQIISGMDRDVILDTGVLVGQLAPAMDTKLGTIYARKERGK